MRSTGSMTKVKHNNRLLKLVHLLLKDLDVPSHHFPILREDERAHLMDKVGDSIAPLINAHLLQLTKPLVLSYNDSRTNFLYHF